MRVSRQLSMRRTALRIIFDDDEEALAVLADQAKEEGWEKLETGRVRKAWFRADRIMSGLRAKNTNPSILRPHERREINSWVNYWWIQVPAREYLHNVGNYISRGRQEERHAAYKTIMVTWVVSKRDIYRQLKRSRRLPASIGFGEIEWEESTITGNRQGFRLFLLRPARDGRLAWFYLMNLERDLSGGGEPGMRKRTDSYRLWQEPPSRRDAYSRRKRR